MDATGTRASTALCGPRLRWPGLARWVTGLGTAGGAPGARSENEGTKSRGSRLPHLAYNSQKRQKASEDHAANHTRLESQLACNLVGEICNFPCFGSRANGLRRHGYFSEQNRDQNLLHSISTF